MTHPWRDRCVTTHARGEGAVQQVRCAGFPGRHGRTSSSWRAWTRAQCGRPWRTTGRRTYPRSPPACGLSTGLTSRMPRASGRSAPPAAHRHPCRTPPRHRRQPAYGDPGRSHPPFAHAVWSGQAALADEWLDRLQDSAGGVVKARLDSLERQLAPLGYPLAVPLDSGELAFASSPLTDYWQVCLPSDAEDPPRGAGQIGRRAGRRRGGCGGRVAGGELADRVEKYIRLHPTSTRS